MKQLLIYIYNEIEKKEKSIAILITPVVLIYYQKTLI